MGIRNEMLNTEEIDVSVQASMAWPSNGDFDAEEA